MFSEEIISFKKFFAGIVLISILTASLIFSGCSGSKTNNKTTDKKQVESQTKFKDKAKSDQELHKLKLLIEQQPGTPDIKTVMNVIDLYLSQRKMEEALNFADKLAKKFPDLEKERYFKRICKNMANNLSLKDRLGKFVFDKKTGLGEFVMQIDCYMNKYTLVRFYVPVDDSGKALPEANDILMYIPWTGEANKTFSSGINKSYLKFAQREKMTIFTFTNWCYRFSYTGDRYFPVKEAGWYPYVFKMKEYIEQKFGLEPHKLFISGQSSGGSMSQRLSAAYPDKIAAAAWNWGTSYTSDIPKKMPPMLVMNNWSPYISHNDNVKWMIEKLKENNNNYILRGYGPPRPTKRGFNYHGASEETLDLIELFIADLCNLRRKNGGKLPAYENWYKITDKSGKNKYYPSMKFYNKWKQLPLNAIKNMESRRPDELLIFPGLVDKPDRVVLYVGPVNIGRSAFNRFCLWDAMYYLAKSGAIAVSVNPIDSLNVNNSQVILNKVFSNKNWKDLNVYIVGVGSAGSTFINGLENFNNPRLKGIKLFDAVVKPVSSKSYKGIPFTVYIPGQSNEKERNGFKYYSPKISPLEAVKLIAEK